MAKLALQGNDAGTGTFTLQAPATNLNRNLVLPDVDGTLSTMEQVKLPIGSFMWFTGTTAPEAFIVADGQLRSRAAFPALWAFAQTSGNISVDDASWTAGQYSPGDGATTFRVPKVDDRFIRGKSATRAVGLVEEDAIRNIYASFVLHGGADANFIADANGAFICTEGSATKYRSAVQLSALNGAASWGRIILDASTTVPTADENRPKALTMLPCIKAYDVISDPNVLNAVGVVNDMARMMPRDENINLGVSVAASGTAVDFVGIPAGVKRITVMFDGVSTNGASSPIMRMGSGSIITDGYGSSGATVSQSNIVGGAIYTSGLLLTGGHAASVFMHGSVTLSRSSTSWVSAGVIGRSDSGAVFISGGSKTLSGPIDRIRITTVNGTDLFDAGTINIAWEF